MHDHIFIPSLKKDISYCKICQLISYKGIICQSLPIKYHLKFNMDPLSLKFTPFSCVANKKSVYHLKYLENKKRGMAKINFLIKNFGLKSMIFYKALCLLDQIFLNNEISIDNIETIALICVLLVVEFNECCMPYNQEDFPGKNENDIIFHTFFNNSYNCRNTLNLKGLFLYIKKNVNNFNYWQILCLKYLNYDLGKYSAYDYLILFFRLGIFFCKENIDIIGKLKICLKILDYIIFNTTSCFYSEYTLAMSIINVAFGLENFFDKNIFKIIYGVDFSKKKYTKCSNMIKYSIIYHNNYSNIFYNINNVRQFNIINIWYSENLVDSNNNKNNLNDNNENENEFNNKFNNCIYGNNSSLTLNNNKIIINNNININNCNFYFRTYFENYKYFSNKFNN